GLGQRTRRKQHALLLQADHVFEMVRQMLGDLFRRRAALGEHDVELLAKHGLGQLANALFAHAPSPSILAGLCGLAARAAASMATCAAAIKDVTEPTCPE